MFSYAVKTARPFAIAAGLMVVSVSLVSSASARPITTSVVMSGLNNPRGLAIGGDGGVYVTEAGTGADGTGNPNPPSVVGVAGDNVRYGATGSVSRFLGGTQSRVLSGLPSLAELGGGSATGLQDIVFSNGVAYGVIGSPGGPNERAALNVSANGVGATSGPGDLFGRLVQLNFGGTPSVNYLADFVPLEGATNPDGTDVNSNPYGLAAVAGGGFRVIDAGANALWNVAPDLNTVSLGATFASQPNPLFATTGGGGPFYQPVPTAVTVGPNGALFVSQLSGYPFKQGGANIYTMPVGGGTPTVAFSGFTTVIDLAFGPDGQLYVLQLTQNGLGPESGGNPGPGQLLRVDPVTGARTVLYVTVPGAPGSLLFSSGMAFGGDGSLYVSNLGVSPGGGQVLRLTGVTVPESGTGLLSLLAVLPIAGLIARRRNK